MRELKFRVWDRLNKQYTHDLYTLSHLDECSTLGFIYIGANVKDYPFIIEQYTGLKDKNGKEIYEGDIVDQFVCGVHQFKGESCGRSTIWQVRWNEEECCFELHYLYGSLFGDSMMSKGEEYVVIGNIHKNPELLGKEKQ